jgi:transposase
MHLRSVKNDSLAKISPTHTESVNRNLTAPVGDRRLSQANAGVVPPRDYRRGHYSMDSRFYGVDVSKETLDVGCDGRVVQIGNEKRAIGSFVRGMPVGSYVVMEATNTYHLEMADICHTRGVRVFVVNPRITSHYRKANGLRGHNDRMDALALSRYIEREHDGLREYVPKSADQRRLKTLVRRRWKLVGMRTQVQESLGSMKELSREVKALLARIDALIAKLELLIDKQLEGNADRARIETIKGVGPIVSAVLISDLACCEFARADAFVAFYGLDPMPDDSGKRRGRRKLSKQGDRLGRAMLYNAAMSAVKSNLWKPMYDRSLARGLTKVQALVVVARKIARTAWSIYTHKTTFNPGRLFQTLT